MLVLGGTGKTGRRIVNRLQTGTVPITDKTGTVPVRVGSRYAAIPFDWNVRETWEAALAGISAVYIAFYSDLAFPDALGTVTDFTKQAVESGVQKLVLLSGRGEPEAELCERVVRSSGAAWTIVRASWFNQNFSESFFQPQITSGYVPFLSNGVLEPFVDTDDIADVASAALVDGRHDGQLYEVTGPRLLSFESAIEEISRISGLRIRYEDLSPERYLELLLIDGVPREFAASLVKLFTGVLDRRNSSLSDGVQRALGREPKDFSAFIREAVAGGAWTLSRR